MNKKHTPYEDQRETSTLYVRVSPEQKAYWVNQANKARMKLAQWVKHQLGYWPED